MKLGSKRIKSAIAVSASVAPDKGFEVNTNTIKVN